MGLGGPKILGRQQHFDKIASLHVNDLFVGTGAAPRKIVKPVKAKKPRAKKAFVPEPKPIKPPAHFKDIACPCCKQRVCVPDIDIIIDHYDVPPLEQAVLRAVWKGKGYPVPNERIFDFMYQDDPDGGPAPNRMYAALKVAMCHLRKRIEGSGVSIANAGYRRGYRLVIGEK